MAMVKHHTKRRWHVGIEILQTCFGSTARAEQGSKITFYGLNAMSDFDLVLRAQLRGKPLACGYFGLYCDFFILIYSGMGRRFDVQSG
jgi:hypothetical protein